MPFASCLDPVGQLAIRTLEDSADFRQAEHVQRKVWGFSDLDIVPAAAFSVARFFGGQTLGAFDGEHMVAFSLAFGAVEHGHAHLHSHMVGVLPAYQNRGIGARLKFAQREDALRRGIEKIVWTFDPLQGRNAHFNLARLGGVGVHYLPNLYGETSSPLHGGMPTDRVVIEWKLNSPRVLAALNGEPSNSAPDAILVELPAVSGDLRSKAKLAAQTELRERLTGLLSAGYLITGFESNAQTASYVLEPQ